MLRVLRQAGISTQLTSQCRCRFSQADACRHGGTQAHAHPRGCSAAIAWCLPAGCGRWRQPSSGTAPAWRSSHYRWADGDGDGDYRTVVILAAPSQPCCMYLHGNGLTLAAVKAASRSEGGKWPLAGRQACAGRPARAAAQLSGRPEWGAYLHTHARGTYTCMLRASYLILPRRYISSRQLPCRRRQCRVPSASLSDPGRLPAGQPHHGRPAAQHPRLCRVRCAARGQGQQADRLLGAALFGRARVQRRGGPAAVEPLGRGRAGRGAWGAEMRA